ncbi:MAG: TRAP transporter substrate-binding protein [Pseudomonadota bacterium]
MNFRLSTVLAGAVALTLGAGSALAQDVTLRFQHFISNAGSVPKYFMIPWGEKIEAESGGRIDFELYPSMQLGGAPPALYQQIADGVIDGGWFIPSYTPGRFPSAEVFELPFVSSKNAEESSRAAWEYYVKYMQEEFKDIKVLAVHVHGPGIIHTKGRTVESIEDMAGLKLRGPSRQANALLSSMGVTPVGMPVPQFPEQLSKGVVDGGVIPWEIVPPLKVHELATAHTEIGGDRSLYNTFFVWAMNPDSYEALPDDLKAVIDANSGLEASAFAGRAMDTGDVPGRETTVATGNTIVTLDEAETSRWREKADPVIDAWLSEMNDRGLPGEAMLDDARALVAEHSSGS